MKMLGIALIVLLNSVAHAHISRPPHLDLRPTIEEYRKLHRAMKRVKNRSKKLSKEAEPQIIGRVINFGTRMLQLQDKINAGSPSRPILLSDANAQRSGISMDSPLINSIDSISSAFEETQKNMPMALKAIIESSEPLPDTLPVTEAEFQKSAARVNWVYGQAVRYRFNSQWMDWYIWQAKRDVRGYHYLVSNKIDAETLKEIATFAPEKQAAVKEALVKVCNNSNTSLEDCEKEITTSALPDFYTKYIAISTAVWKSFFEIPADKKRKDIEWSTELTTLPFITPELEIFVPYLKNNIEEEFRWNGWKLILNIGQFTDAPALTFVPGVTPHVEELGGNKIVMDKNQSIEEYSAQWTIRHEFGHILGLPDCYHEFFDVKLKAFVNYELDTTDLMCSRAGNMNERIFNELKRNYEKVIQ